MMIRHVAAVLAMALTSAMAMAEGHFHPTATPPVFAQAPQPTPEEAAVASLQKEFMVALMEYQKPLIEAKTQEERSAIKLDPEKNPAKAFYPRFRELGLKYGKTSAGFNAWVLAGQTAGMAGDEKAAEDVQELMLRDYVNTPQFATYVPRLMPIGIARVPAEERNAKIEALLARVETNSQDHEVLAAVIARRANMAASDEVRFAELNRMLLAKYPKTAAGKRAKGAIFEAENLSVGKVAPDFESEDIDGKKFKLSDYRGKVVVLEFWGFW